MEYVALFVAVVVIAAMINSHLTKKRREQLLAKYGDLKIVDMIMQKMFWQGQTPEQLIDSLGRPVDVDRKVLKTKTKEVWKYNQTGRGRFGLRITVEDGYVVGWDKKS